MNTFTLHRQECLTSEAAPWRRMQAHRQSNAQAFEQSTQLKRGNAAGQGKGEKAKNEF